MKRIFPESAAQAQQAMSTADYKDLVDWGAVAIEAGDFETMDTIRLLAIERAEVATSEVEARVFANLGKAALVVKMYEDDY